MTLDWSFLRSFKALLSCFETLLCTGSRALWRMAADVVLTASFETSGRWRIAASISATMFLCGMVVGVGANFGPFSKRDRSSGERGLLERFTTQLFLSMMDWLRVGFKFSIFFACLLSMLLWKVLALFFKNDSKVKKVSSWTREDRLICLTLATVLQYFKVQKMFVNMVQLPF